VTCDEVLELLPDRAMGTLSDTEDAAVRRHLRGCGGCRVDAVSLDRGVAMFASAAHAVDPPPELREQVMSSLADEWADQDRMQRDRPSGGHSGRPRRSARWLAVAAAAAAIVGALAWGATEHSNAHDATTRLAAVSEYASAYQRFLHALGGRDVRVAELRATTSVQIAGVAILYDSDRHQSWGLVELTAPEYREPLTVTLVSTTGETLELPFPVRIDADGHGTGWLATSADISSFRTVRVSAPGGTVMATGAAPRARS
jgi:hypothetical protein